MSKFLWVALLMMLLGTSPGHALLDLQELPTLLSMANIWGIHLSSLDANLICGLFPGITCENGHVVHLNFSGQCHRLALMGSIPLSLSALTEIRTLYAQTSRISNGVNLKIPAPPTGTLVDALKSEGRCLASSAVSPSSLQWKRFLKAPRPDDASNSLIEGTIPTTLASLFNLETLKLDHTYISGSIPDIFARLLKLKELSLSGLQLVDEIPTSIWQSRSLIKLDLSSNHLTGSMPAILEVSLMANLNLSNNFLHGLLPESIGGMLQMVTIDISFNYFNICNINLNTTILASMSSGFCLLNNQQNQSCGLDCLSILPNCMKDDNLECDEYPTPFDILVLIPPVALPPINIPAIVPPVEMPPVPPSWIVPQEPSAAWPIAINCPGLIPGPGFVCSQGLWVFQGDYEIIGMDQVWNDNIVIAGNVVLKSNSHVLITGMAYLVGDLVVDTSSVVAFTGIFGGVKRGWMQSAEEVPKMNLSGCVQIAGSIEISLTEEESQALQTTGSRSVSLIESSCQSPAIVTTVKASAPPCKSASGSTTSQDLGNGRHALSALLTMSPISNGCGKRNLTWVWIFIGVLSGVALIVVIVIILGVKSPKLRNMVRPYRNFAKGDRSSTRKVWPENKGSISLQNSANNLMDNESGST